MPRQRIDYNRITYQFPDDFPERLKRFQQESGLSWAEIARRIGTYPHTLWRWRCIGVRPSAEHMMALLDLAHSLGLSHLFTGWTGPDGARHESSAEAVPPQSRSPGRKAAQRQGGSTRPG